MGDVDHIHILDIGRELLLAFVARPPRFILIVAAGLAFALAFDCHLDGLLDDLAIPVSVVGRLVRSS